MVDAAAALVGVAEAPTAVVGLAVGAEMGGTAVVAAGVTGVDVPTVFLSNPV